MSHQLLGLNRKRAEIKMLEWERLVVVRRTFQSVTKTGLKGRDSILTLLSRHRRRKKGGESSVKHLKVVASCAHVSLSIKLAKWSDDNLSSWSRSSSKALDSGTVCWPHSLFSRADVVASKPMEPLSRRGKIRTVRTREDKGGQGIAMHRGKLLHPREEQSNRREWIQSKDMIECNGGTWSTAFGSYLAFYQWFGAQGDIGDFQVNIAYARVWMAKGELAGWDRSLTTLRRFASFSLCLSVKVLGHFYLRSRVHVLDIRMYVKMPQNTVTLKFTTLLLLVQMRTGVVMYAGINSSELVDLRCLPRNMPVAHLW